MNIDMESVKSASAATAGLSIGQRMHVRIDYNMETGVVYAVPVKTFGCIEYEEPSIALLCYTDRPIAEDAIIRQIEIVTKLGIDDKPHNEYY